MKNEMEYIPLSSKEGSYLETALLVIAIVVVIVVCAVALIYGI